MNSRSVNLVVMLVMCVAACGCPKLMEDTAFSPPQPPCYSFPATARAVYFQLYGTEEWFELDMQLVSGILSGVLSEEHETPMYQRGYTPGLLHVDTETARVTYTLFSTPRWVKGVSRGEAVYFELEPADHSALLDHVEEAVRPRVPDLRSWPRGD